MEPRPSWMVFLAPSFPDLPRSRPVWRGQSSAANMRIKYVFIVQRLGLIPAAGLCTTMWSLTGVVALVAAPTPEVGAAKARGS
jgi:hypothetical protein